MATWSIEHIPANGGASTFASLGVWGFASLQMQFVNWGIDQATVTTRGGSIAFEAAQFAYLDKLVVWRNGARFAHFWITGLGLSAEQSESRTYTLSGPAWWLNQYAPGDTSNVTLYTAGAYIALGMGAAIAAGAPVGCDSGVSAALNIGCPDVRSAGTVLALVQEAARHVPFSSGWWDCSGETPILHASRRSALSTVTIALVTAAVETFGLTPIPELQLKSVRIRFGWTGGASYYYDTAGTGSDLSGPNRLQCALNYGTQAAALEAAGCGVAEKVFADMSALPWSGAVNLHATEDTDIDPIRPGCALNLTGGRDEWTTMGALVKSVDWFVSPEVNDCCTINLGAPDNLGIQDYFELRSSVGSGAAAESDAAPVDPSSPIPGTLADLNGTSTGGGEPGGSIPVQSRGGAWELKGWPERGAPSVPPKRYLCNMLSGTTYYACEAHDVFPACTVEDHVWGANTFDPDTGAVTNGAYTQVGPVSGCCLGGSPESFDPDLVGGDGYPYSAVSGTVQTVTRTTVRYDPPASWPAHTTAFSGFIQSVLSNEDTPSSAEARLFAAAAWVGGGATTAIRTVPTTGITGIYRRIRYRTEHTAAASSSHWVFGAWVDGVWVPGHSVTVSESTVYPTLTGLAIWSRYRLKIVLQKRPVDAAGAAAGDYVTGETIYSAPFSTDINGEGGVDWTEIEPEAGYETAIQSATPELY